MERCYYDPSQFLVSTFPWNRVTFCKLSHSSAFTGKKKMSGARSGERGGHFKIFRSIRSCATLSHRCLEIPRPNIPTELMSKHEYLKIIKSILFSWLKILIGTFFVCFKSRTQSISWSHELLKILSSWGSDYFWKKKKKHRLPSGQLHRLLQNKQMSEASRSKLFKSMDRLARIFCWIGLSVLQIWR